MLVLNKRITYLQQRYYRSTIKMHESSPVAAALVFLFHLSGWHLGNMGNLRYVA